MSGLAPRISRTPHKIGESSGQGEVECETVLRVSLPGKLAAVAMFCLIIFRPWLDVSCPTDMLIFSSGQGRTKDDRMVNL